MKGKQVSNLKILYLCDNWKVFESHENNDGKFIYMNRTRVAVVGSVTGE